MENILLNLSSGYIVSFKPFLTHGQKRELTRFISSKMNIDPTTGKAQTQLTGDTLMDAQDLTLKLMLNYVQKPDGTKFIGEAAFQEVLNMRDEEGTAVYAKLDELSGTSKDKTPEEIDEAKKNLSLTSLNSSNQEVV